MKNSILLTVILIFIGCSNQNQPAFKELAKDTVVLAPGLNGEWDAGALGSMTVVKAKDTFHMYYEAWGELSKEGTQSEYETLQIGHATSQDGINWSKDPGNPAIAQGDSGEWDSDGTWDPFVIYEDGIFKMWYGGNIGFRGAWGYATSVDGINFEKKGKIGPFGDVEDIHVVHNPYDNKYYSFYWDRAKAPWDSVMDGPPSPSGLVVAVSDNETNFDFPNAKCLEVKGQTWPVKYSQVIRENDLWVMFYGEAVTRGNPSSTGIATSLDLINWTKKVFPIFKGHDAEVIKISDDLWYLYYAPDAYFDMPGCDIRLAIYKGKLSKLYDKEE